jgi:hypothetical protein
LIARLEWELYRRHTWLYEAVSFTRPLYAPTMVAHTEWTLRALAERDLPARTRIREALVVHSIVLTAAASLAEERSAEIDTGLSLDRGRRTQQPRQRETIDPVRFPFVAAIPPGMAEDLEALFEYGLARHLDGFAVHAACPS